MITRTLLSFTLSLALALAACSQSETSRADQSQPPSNEPVQSVQPAAFDSSYSDYTSVLEQYVIGYNVDYAALQQQRSNLDAFVSQLAGLTAEYYDAMTNHEKLSLWINAYNGITLRSIIDHYPVESIKDISGVWDKTQWPVAGREVTLDEIEHKIIRPEFRDERIHFAVNCASRGCPPLMDRVFSGDSLDAQLDAVSRSFINDPERTVIDGKKGMLGLSLIFKWFTEDFQSTGKPHDAFANLDPTEASAASFVYRFADDGLRRRLEDAERLRIEYLDYDWQLNDTTR